MTVATISQNTGATYAGVSHTTLFEDMANVPVTDGYGSALVIQSVSASRRHSTLTFGGLSNIPAGASISDASIVIRCVGGSGVADSVSLYRLKVPHAGRLVERWDIRDAATPWTSVGGNNATDIDTTPTATVAVTSSNGQVATFSGAGLVALVQGWVNGTTPNYGFLVAQTNEAAITGNGINFSSPDNVTQGPVLTVTYTTAPTITGVSSASNAEGSAIVHTVTMSAATSATTNYAASITGSTATIGTDLVATLAGATFSAGVTFSGGNLVVPSGVSSFTVSIPTTDDALNEAAEAYTLTVGGATGTGSITDNDPLPSVSISDATQSGGTVTHTVTLSAASGRAVSVNYATSNGTKTAGVDYVAVTGTLTFAPGETSKTIAVTVL